MSTEADRRATWSLSGAEPAYQKTNDKGYRIYPLQTCPIDSELRMTPEELNALAGVRTALADETHPETSEQTLP